MALIQKHFKHNSGRNNSQNFQPPVGLHEASRSVTPSDAALGDPNNGGSIVAVIAPYPGGDWPEVWIALVESIRGSPYGLAWEIFSGCQSITQALSHRGWTCAPPVDVSDSQWFNLLNPVFVSIIVGIILEGRITLLILDPPLGGSPNVCQEIWDVATTISKAMFRIGGHVIWCGGGSDQVALNNRIYVSSCRFGTPWCRTMVFSSTCGGILQLGALCKDRCGLRKLSIKPSIINRENHIWPMLADSVAKCVDGIMGVIVEPKCTHLAGFSAPMGGK